MPTPRVFFCFHLENDLWRIEQIRSELGGAFPEQAGYFDPVEYEALLRKDKASIRSMIRERIEGTSVTLVLIGSETASRPFVQLEIEESIANRSGFLGIHIHAVDDQAGEPSFTGPRPILPDEVEFPCFLWDWDLARLTEEIEAAGRRADRWRSTSRVGSGGSGR